MTVQTGKRFPSVHRRARRLLRLSSSWAEAGAMLLDEEKVRGGRSDAFYDCHREHPIVRRGLFLSTDGKHP